MKYRILDVVVSLIGCIVLFLMLPIVFVLIKLDSRGPVFFKCDRVGKNGKVFRMYKFRTMYETQAPLGPSVSPLGDPRITTVGQILRRLKINELPQFFNVLKGDMTLIGPRPEAPDLAAAYPPEARPIFSAKPGVLGPNQILGRNEDELYPPDVDHKTYYFDHILPQKLPVDLQYIKDKSLFKDLKYLLLGAWVTISGSIARRHLFDNLTQIFMILSDALLCIFSLIISHLLRFDGFSQEGMNQALLILLPFAVILRLPIFIYYGFYHTLIRHLSFLDIKNIFYGVCISSFVFTSVSLFFGITPGYSRGVFFVDLFILTIILVLYRLFLKLLQQYCYKENNYNGNKKRVLIWGAGDSGDLCLRYLQKKANSHYEVVGFIDDDPKKRNRRLNGVKILGGRHHLDILCQLYKIHELFVTFHPGFLDNDNITNKLISSLGITTKFFVPKFDDYPHSSLMQTGKKPSMV